MTFRIENPEDDPKTFRQILHDTYERAYEKDPVRTSYVMKHFEGQDQLQWLQNIIDGYY